MNGKVCEKLNALIPCKTQEGKDALNAALNELVFDAGGDLYWHRDVFLACDCGCDDKKMRSLVTDTELVEFVPSDDPEEHLGVVVRFKEI